MIIEIVTPDIFAVKVDEVPVNEPIMFSDSLGCTARVNGMSFRLLNGQSVKKAYEKAYPKISFPFMKRVVEVFVYRIEYNGVVGTRFHAMDRDGKTLERGTNWSYSIKVDYEVPLMNKILECEKHQMHDVDLWGWLRDQGRLAEFIKVAIENKARTISLQELNSYKSTIANDVSRMFDENDGYRQFGINLTNLVCNSSLI